MARNSLKSNISSNPQEIAWPNPDSTIAHLGIAPGVVETMIARAASDVPGVAAVGGPKVDKRWFNSVLTKQEGITGVEIAEEQGDLVLDIRVQIFYGYKLQDIVDGIKSNVTDALFAQAGIKVDAINVYVSALQFEE